MQKNPAPAASSSAAAAPADGGRSFAAGLRARAPALGLAAVACASAFVYQYGAGASYPALDLRPYFGGESTDAAPPRVALFGPAFGLLVYAAFRAVESAVARGGFKRHAPAVALAFSLFLFSPAFGAAFRFDHASFLDRGSAPAVDASLGGFSGRLRAGVRAFLEAPAIAYSRDPRLDLPTGQDGVLPSRFAGVGAAVWALFAAAGMMLAGVRRTARSLVLGFGVAVSLAVFLPGYLPGAPWAALPVLACAVPTLAFALTTAGAPVVRSVGAGLAAGLCLMTLLGAYDRAPWLAKRSAALRAGRVEAVGEARFETENDPARLLLVAWEARRLPPSAATVVSAAARRARELLDLGAPALDPARLEVLLESLPATGVLQAPGVAAGSRTPRYGELTTALRRELDIVGPLIGGNLAANYRQIVGLMLESSLLADAAELRELSPADPDARGLIERVRLFCDAMSEPAARCGDFAHVFQFREAWRDLAAPGSLTATQIAEFEAATGVLRILADEPARGLEAVRAHVEAAGGRGAAPGLRRGAIGLAFVALGDHASAMKWLKECWDLLGGKVRDPYYGLGPDDIDYWILTEAAYARYVAAQQVDPGLAPQALRDVEALVANPLKAPRPVLPAFVLGAAVKIAAGRPEEALPLLREARRVDGSDLVDRLDGVGGRIAWPRYRRMALRHLRDLLVAPADAAERAAVEAELAAL